MSYIVKISLTERFHIIEDAPHGFKYFMTVLDKMAKTSRSRSQGQTPKCRFSLLWPHGLEKKKRFYLYTCICI
jgi:hypothetical protein